MSDVLNLLWDSTDDLHRRFDLFPPNPEATLRVFDEETQEFGEAAGAAIQEEYVETWHVCSEAADAIVTILATLSGLGITREDFAKWAQVVANKNNAKTWDTHFVNPETGKIQRKGRV